ncbi:TolC family protein [Flavobacterium ammonificans]|uniref:TolC family protein n=1 Tax=Flavobacterium ammonificans TaxID=1751056 RepID=UPI001E3B81BA|nr:TolC family protein [Flavobacterium ammonificans]BDB57340.1 transporter [Flavobacterium ammonificans]
MKNCHRIKIFYLIVFSVFSSSYSQEVLTIENAIKIALENNFEIKIASNNYNIAKTNSTIGNAGMLPTLTASVAANNRVQNSTLTLQNGVVNALDNALNNSLNYGVSLDWTIFNGFKMFTRLEQLKELEKLGSTQLQQTIISKLSEVSSTYFNLVQQQQQLKALDSTLVISNQRLALAQNRFAIGKASKLEVLNAQVDLNTDNVVLLKQQEVFQNTKTLLNKILARDLQTQFNVIEKIKVDENLKLTELSDLVEKQNPQLVSLLLSKNVAELQLKQIKGDRYPVITLSSGYVFSETQASLGFAAATSARGFNYGFNAALNLFNGWNQNRNEKIAKIMLDNSKLTLNSQRLELQAQLNAAYQTYLTNNQLVVIENKNEIYAKQNLDITLDKFKIGTITTLEFRTAQLNYVNAKVRNSNAQFQAKLSEIVLKELAGIINLD